MSSDPADNGVPPDRDLVERALRVARYERQLPARSSSVAGDRYWTGAVEALRWCLGERGTGPVSGEVDSADLDEPRRRTIRQEALYTYECMRGDRRPSEGNDMEYMTGVENTLMWVATGHGFAGVLDAGWLRQHYGLV
jgi:hypothetical protein